MCFNMSKKSNLLKEIGNIIDKNCSEFDIHDLNFEIIKTLNTKMMNLDDSRHGSYELHYMNEIVSLSKEIDFNTMIDRITSISLEHTLMKDGEFNIKGDLIVTGTYKQTVASQIDNPFSYKIPVDIELDPKYDLSNVNVDIDDFTYEVIDDNKLKINVDLILNNLEKKEISTVLEDTSDDELVSVNDLFLEDSKDEKLEVPKEKMETLDFDEEKVNVVEKVNDVKEDLSESLFSNIDSSNESYSTYSVYIMRENDSLEDIMKKYDVTREQLEEYNNLDEVKMGSKLIVPTCNEKN